MDGMKYCKGCDTTKPWSAFTIRADNGKPVTLCKTCRNARNRTEHVPNVPEQTEHVSEQYAEIIARLDMLQAENAELRRMIASLSNGETRQAAEVNININAPLPLVETPKEEAMIGKLTSIDFGKTVKNIQ